LLALKDGQVFFRWKDYADDHRIKVMRLTADEFIRRFSLHVLPKGGRARARTSSAPRVSAIKNDTIFGISLA
jgi:hypothetical protein